jgi:OmpA-OmpF porin, OOP family
MNSQIDTTSFQSNSARRIILRQFHRLLLYIVFFLLTGKTVNAQYGNSGYFNQAAKLFEQKDYYGSAQAFEKYLSSEKKNGPRSQPFDVEKKRKGKNNRNIHQEAVYMLAESYRMYNDFGKAEKRYKEATAFPTAAFPLCRYWYGVTLRTNKKYDEAIESLNKFIETYTEMGPIITSADLELENLKFIQKELSRKHQDFILTQQQISGSSSSYALSVKQEDTVVFTSIHRDDPAVGSTNPSYNNELYESVAGDKMIDQAHKLPFPNPNGIQNGLACFTPDGKKIFFTRWYKKEGKNIAAIFTSSVSDTGWTEPELAPDPINQEGYNSAQPFITVDGKYLLFSSDRPGGLGNYDIWYANLDTNFLPVNVANIGNTINSPGDEESPFFHQNERTLIFSSNGRTGMGGFDIYYAKGNYNLTNWEKPVNPGTPINSTKDDLYYISTDKDNCWNTGWLSSDRASDCCLGLFSVLQDNALDISGLVYDCKTHRALSGVSITLVDLRHGGRIISSRNTDSTGHYNFELKNVSGFRVRAEKEGYKIAEDDYTVHLEPGKGTFDTRELCLTQNTTKLQQELKNLSANSTLGNFAYKKAKLNAAYNANLDSLVSLMKRNPGMTVEIGGYTDGIGGEAYNLRLAKARVDACIKYLVQKGISKKRVIGKAYGECCPLEPETIDGKDNPAARKKNRRVEYKLMNDGETIQ